MRALLLGEDIAAVTSANLPWKDLAGKTVVVTGAAGFLGGYLVRVLTSLARAGKISAPVKVVAVVRDVDKAKLKFDLGSGGGADLEFVQHDLSNPSGLHLEGDWFIHAASLASPKYYGKFPVETYAPNILGTHHLLQLAKACSAEKFAFISSSEVYGRPLNSIPVDEKSFGFLDPATARAAYAESKRMGETICTAWMHQHKIPVFIARPFHTYGPGLALDDGRVFADLVADAVHGRDILLNSDGSAKRAFCYVTDAITAIFHVLLLGQAGQAYNVGNKQAVLSVLELAEMICSLVPEKKITVKRKAQSAGYLPSVVPDMIPDTSLIESIGWNPSIDPRKGFDRMIKSY